MLYVLDIDIIGGLLELLPPPWYSFPTAYDIGLAQPGLPGGAFGASLQGPGKEVAGGPASRRTRLTGITCVSIA